MQRIHKELSSDKRADTRVAADFPIALSLFQTCSDFNAFETRTCNQSTSGVCFATGRKLHPKSIVFIRALKPDQALQHQGMLSRSTTLGEVRWCRQMVDLQEERYMVGVRYF